MKVRSECFRKLMYLINFIILPMIINPAQSFGGVVNNIRKIKIAIIDTGLSVKHDYFYGQNGIKKEYLEGNLDTDGHGTHIAGIITRNTIGHDVEIIPIKIQAYSQDLSLEIHKAIESGADIINISISGSGDSEKEFLALKTAQQKGILIIVAAGNTYRNEKLSQKPFPASYKEKLSNIIVVGSINKDYTSPYHYDKDFLPELYAFGQNVLSAGLTKDTLIVMSGTSQATAKVTSVAAKILTTSVIPTDVSKIKDSIISYSSGEQNALQITSCFKQNVTSMCLNSPNPEKELVLTQRLGK